jgi:hypothetical protein
MSIVANCDCYNFELKYSILSAKFEDDLFISMVRTRAARCVFLHLADTDILWYYRITFTRSRLRCIQGIENDLRDPKMKRRRRKARERERMGVCRKGGQGSQRAVGKE